MLVIPEHRLPLAAEVQVAALHATVELLDGVALGEAGAARFDQ